MSLLSIQTHGKVDERKLENIIPKYTVDPETISDGR